MLIIVLGKLPDQSLGSWLGFGYVESGPDFNMNPTLYPDDGSSGPPQGIPLQSKAHDETCHHADGAAAQIAETITATDDVVGPTLYDWNTAEYSALVENRGNGRFGAKNGAIYSRGLRFNSSVPRPGDADGIAGIIHNHTKIPKGIVLMPNQYAENSYPSDRDWEGLLLLWDQFNDSVPNYDPVSWIVGPDGITRRFKLSERTYIKSLSTTEMSDGVGLDEREVENDC